MLPELDIDYTRFKPLRNEIVVEVVWEERTTRDGILINVNRDFVKDRPIHGKVISQGPKCKYDLMGKEVVFSYLRGQDIDETHMLIRESTLLGIINFESDETPEIEILNINEIL